MREILFRGKRLDNGEWVEGFYISHLNSCHYIIPCRTGGYEAMDYSFYVHKWYEVDPSTVGQFTGLTDKNGKRIFEGDIIPVWEQGEEYPYKVVYCGDCFVLSMLDSEQGSYPLSLKCNASEVIGNIYDNPELMEVDHE